MISDDPATSQLIDEFRGLVLALRSGEGTVWLSIDLTMPQLKALFIVCVERRMSGRDLSRALRVGPSAITPLVDRLVDHGYVRREEDVEDRRITWIRPTEKGLGLMDHLRTTRREQFGRIVSRLSPDERRLVTRALAVLRRAAEDDQLQNQTMDEPVGGDPKP